MREEHMEQVERWAHFVKENPAKWKKSHTEFINALFEKHYSFLKKNFKNQKRWGKLKKIIKKKKKKGYISIKKPNQYIFFFFFFCARAKLSSGVFLGPS